MTSSTPTGRTCRVCYDPEHPAAPFVGGLCDRCAHAAAKYLAQEQAKLVAANPPPPPVAASRPCGQQRNAVVAWLTQPVRFSFAGMRRICGGLAIAIGVMGAIAALNADTSVALGPEFGGQRVHNLSLAHQQQTAIIVSCVVIVGGLLATIPGRR